MNRRARTQVRDLMTGNVLGVRETELLGRAPDLMEETGIADLAVVDDRRRVVGMLSLSDRAHALFFGAGDGARLDGWMAGAARAVRPGTPAHEAARILLRSHVGALPVVDDDERLVGILTAADFLGVALRALDRRDSEAFPPLAEAG